MFLNQQLDTFHSVIPKNFFGFSNLYTRRHQCFCQGYYCLSLVSFLIKTRRLPFFGHVAHSDPRQDYHRAISVSLRPTSDWRRPQGCPHTTWLRGIDHDVQSANSLEEGQWLCALKLYHQHGYTPLGICHWWRSFWTTVYMQKCLLNSLGHTSWKHNKQY